MKKIKFLAFVLFAVLACVSFSSCSDDDKDEPSSGFSSEILGTWQCVESDYLGYSGDDDEIGFKKGEHLIFFNGNGKTDDNLLSGKKCFILYGSENPKGYTESSWEEGDDLYTLNQNKLTVFESDLDRFVGTVTIKDGEMTFTYKYQNWNYDLGQMTGESKQYTSKFRKI